ncbi:cyclin-like protein [Zopfochytrium polystomum]|nr:cyclin-like protein [Zopfochytrium polystomum]
MASQVQTRRLAAAAKIAKKTVGDENAEMAAALADAQKLKSSKPTTRAFAAANKENVDVNLKQQVRERGALRNIQGPNKSAGKVVKQTRTSVRSQAKQTLPAVALDADAVALVTTKAATTVAAAHAESSSAPRRVRRTRTSEAPAVEEAARVVLGELEDTVPEKAVTASDASVEPMPPPPEMVVAEVVNESAVVPAVEEDKHAQEMRNEFDAEELKDPMIVAEYTHEIMQYMRELEKSTLPNADYMSYQENLSWNMRSLLVDWLIDIHHKLKLLPETLFLAVNIVDRFLSMRVIRAAKLQLVGVAATLIASKYEEIISPTIRSLVALADNVFTDVDVIRAERFILVNLEFNIRYPSPMSFLRRTSKADNYDVQTRTLAKYFMEITLVDYRCLAMTPSLVAAASLLLARRMLNRGEWHDSLVYYSGYTEAELTSCVSLILRFLHEPTKFDAVHRKYAAKRFLKASEFAQQWIATEFREDE